MIITAGSTDVSVYFYVVQDAGASAPGEPHTGMLFSDLTSASYARQGAARVAITPVTLASASAAHSDGGFILVDDTNMPGVYRLDVPDAAFATGVDQVFIHFVPAAGQNATVSPLAVDLTEIDFRDDGLTRSGGLLQTTTIATLASQTSFTLTAGSADDDAYNRCPIVIRDQTTGVQKTVSYADDYAGSTRTVTLDATHTPRFTIAVGDFVDVYAQMTQTPGFFHESTITPTGEYQVDSFTTTARTILQLEAEDALETYNLDHLVGTATGIPTLPAGTYLDILQDDGSATYDRTTDSLQAIRDDLSGRLPAALVGGRIDANAGAISGSATAADNMELIYIRAPFQTGSVTNTPSDGASFIDTAISYTDDDDLNGLVCVFTDGVNQGIARKIEDFTGASRTVSFTTSPFPNTIGNGDNYLILGRID